MNSWTKTTRPMKRALSGFEKESFPVTHRQGKLLVMPAEPRTEVEELLAIGADYRDIVAIERDQGKADGLYEYYFDQMPVHWIEASQFMTRAETAAYSYVHLDYCGHLREDEVGAIAESARILAPHARLRVSLLKNRKVQKTERFEAFLRDSMLMALIHQLTISDESLGWNEMAAAFKDSEDSTQLVAAVVIIAHFFGLDPFVFADMCATGLEGIPPVQGKHFIYNVSRWCYHEPGHPPVMETIWFDMMRMPEQMQQLNNHAITGPLFGLLQGLIAPAPQFALVIGEVDVND